MKITSDDVYEAGVLVWKRATNTAKVIGWVMTSPGEWLRTWPKMWITSLFLPFYLLYRLALSAMRIPKSDLAMLFLIWEIVSHAWAYMNTWIGLEAILTIFPREIFGKRVSVWTRAEWVEEMPSLHRAMFTEFLSQAKVNFTNGDYTSGPLNHDEMILYEASRWFADLVPVLYAWADATVVLATYRTFYALYEKGRVMSLEVNEDFVQALSEITIDVNKELYERASDGLYTRVWLDTTGKYRIKGLPQSGPGVISALTGRVGEAAMPYSSVEKVDKVRAFVIAFVTEKGEVMGHAFRVGNYVYTALHVWTVIQGAKDVNIKMGATGKVYAIDPREWAVAAVSEDADVVMLRPPNPVLISLGIRSAKFDPKVTTRGCVERFTRDGPGQSWGQWTTPAEGFFAHHHATTEAGASGAPFISPSGRVVGMHLGCEPRKDKPTVIVNVGIPAMFLHLMTIPETTAVGEEESWDEDGTRQTGKVSKQARGGVREQPTGGQDWNDVRIENREKKIEAIVHREQNQLEAVVHEHRFDIKEHRVQRWADDEDKPVNDPNAPVPEKKKGIYGDEEDQTPLTGADRSAATMVNPRPQLRSDSELRRITPEAGNDGAPKPGEHAKPATPSTVQIGSGASETSKEATTAPTPMPVKRDQQAAGLSKAPPAKERETPSLISILRALSVASHRSVSDQVGAQTSQDSSTPVDSLIDQWERELARQMSNDQPPSGSLKSAASPGPSVPPTPSTAPSGSTPPSGGKAKNRKKKNKKKSQDDLPPATQA